MSEEIKNDLLKSGLQYGDWEGWAEADIADHCNNDMQYYLATRFEQFDAERYQCKGCRICISNGKEASLDFICLDKMENKFIVVKQANEMTIGQIFGLFKRFNIVIGENIKEMELNDEDCLVL